MTVFLFVSRRKPNEINYLGVQWSFKPYTTTHLSLMRVSNPQANIALVVSDLLSKRIPAWRNIDALDSGADLIVLIPNEGLMMVKVRTGYRRPKGSIYWNKSLKEDADLYAVVIERTVHYITPRGDRWELD